MVHKDFTRLSQSSILILFSLLCLGLFFSVFFVVQKPLETPYSLSFAPFERSMSTFSKFSGPLISLGEEKLTYSFPDIRSELEVFLHKKRPDLNIEKKEIGISLKQGKALRNISLGEKVFLRYDLIGGHSILSFSEKDTGFFLVPIRLDHDSLLFETYLHSENFLIEDPPYDYKTFILKAKSPQQTRKDDLSPPFSMLFEMNWLGPDCYLETYDPKTRKKDRLLGHGMLLEIEEGDFLVYRNEKWELVNDGKSEKCLLAHVKKVGPKNLEIEGWNETGEEYFFFSLPKQSIDPVKTKPEQLISNIRMRTLRQVSLNIENEKLVMKVGEIAAKISGKWKVLKNEEDMQAYMQNPSEIFVIDGIERKSHQKILKGHIFNRTKTHGIEVHIPLDYGKSQKTSQSPSDKRSSRSEKIKKSLSNLPKHFRGKKK